MKFYSKTTDSFYVQEIHGDNKPSDCIEITDELWQELVNGRAEGKVVNLSEDGVLSLVDAPPLSTEELLDNATHLRANAYKTESDPIFFKWQRGEALEQDWVDKVAEIKARYPKP